MSKIKIDELHRKSGFTVLKRQQVAGRKTSNRTVPWPDDRGFRPRGITLQEARDAMVKCVAGRKVCKQCKRMLPASHFDVTEKARKANPGIEDYCSLCWACP